MDSLQTLGALYKTLKASLAAVTPDSADLEARWIIEECLGLVWADIIAYSEMVLAQDMILKIKSDLEARCAGKPLSRIYGRREFWGMDFSLNEATLDPRPDSEVLVRAVLSQFIHKNSPLSILDLGTGTGCLLLSLLSEYQNATGLGVDVSARALEAAQINAAQHGLESRTGFACGSWFDSVPSGALYDVIVSNPPYIAESVIPDLSAVVQNHDPILALSGGQDGLDAYKNIFSELKKFLKPDGYAFFEIGYDQADEVTRLARNAGFYVTGILPDSAGLARVAVIRHGDKS
jgi:release factor glutamine methyltransferase